MARIRHLGMKTLNPEKLAKFYEEVFDMKVILRRESTPSPPSRERVCCR